MSYQNASLSGAPLSTKHNPITRRLCFICYSLIVLGFAVNSARTSVTSEIVLFMLGPMPNFLWSIIMLITAFWLHLEILQRVPAPMTRVVYLLVVVAGLSGHEINQIGTGLTFDALDLFATLVGATSALLLVNAAAVKLVQQDFSFLSVIKANVYGLIALLTVLVTGLAFLRELASTTALMELGFQLVLLIYLSRFSNGL